MKTELKANTGAVNTGVHLRLIPGQVITIANMILSDQRRWGQDVKRRYGHYTNK